jgi:parallel beta-helix repeat protein
LDYTTIQEAVDASETLDGDTIFVDAGTYNENIDVYKELSLIGEGSEVTIISAADSSKNVISVTSSYVEISGFKITGATEWNSASGIYLEDVSYVFLSHNYVTNNTEGIRLSLSNDNAIVNNTVYANYFGIDLEQGNSYNWIADNNSTSNTAYGIVIWSGSDNNLVARNIFIDNNRGITLGYSDFNGITYNNVSDNSFGIEIQQVSNNNVIFHNNIINNNAQTQDVSGSVNVWDNDYPSGGNYWSDYIGADMHSGPYQNETGWDGIGDTEYTIDANNTDFYPLMAPISIFDVDWNGTFYNVDIVSNSTISNFQLNATQKAINFNATGETGLGFCRVTVPNAIVRGMWQGSYTVLVNEQPVEFRSWTGEENTYIYFTYQHSTKEVTIIPEFPLALILSLLIMFTFVAVTLSKRKQLPKEQIS